MSDATEIQTSQSVKLTGGDEALYASIESECGQNRVFVSGVERATDSIRCGSIAISTTALVLRVGASALTGRRSIQIQNVGQQAVYLGPSTVTVGTGIILYPKSSVVYDLKETIHIYAIASSSGQEVRIMEFA